jgi:uncharacterized protein (TIGR02611 family)
MSPGVEDRWEPRADTEAASAAGATLQSNHGETVPINGHGPQPHGHQQTPSRPGSPASAEHGEHHEHHHHHHVLIEPEEDRWRWRRKIRQNPRQLAVYRLLVGFLGLLLVCLGFISGPLPGPGGIPLVLAGLAIWSSEFEWAHQLMHWFKAQLVRYRTLSPHWKIACWVIFFACCLLIGFGYLVVLGLPSWLPDSVARGLEMLPWID